MKPNLRKHLNGDFNRLNKIEENLRYISGEDMESIYKSNTSKRIFNLNIAKLWVVDVKVGDIIIRGIREPVIIGGKEKKINLLYLVLANNIFEQEVKATRKVLGRRGEEEQECIDFRTHVRIDALNLIAPAESKSIYKFEFEDPEKLITVLDPSNKDTLWNGI